MKAFFVTAGTKRAAATRYRVSQYLPLFKKRGIEYDTFSITSDFMTRYMIKSPETGSVQRLIYYALFLIERFIRSWAIIFRASWYDRIFLQRVTFPIGFERLLKRMNSNIIFDIDDAIFLPDVQGSDPLTKLKKFIKEHEVKAILKVSSCVIVENDYIKKYVSQFCPHIYKIPGPIDTDRYFVKKTKETKNVVIGWIGSPATTGYLNILNNVFSEIFRKYDNVSVHLIGVGRYSLPDGKIEKIPWHYNTEVEELQKFDIGLMSMPDNEWTRGKLGCKMLQYMALGIPAIVSDTQTNREIMTNGVNGFLVKTEEEWINSIDRLMASNELRRTLGKNARSTIEEKCSLKRSVDLLVDILEKT